MSLSVAERSKRKRSNAWLREQLVPHLVAARRLRPSDAENCLAIRAAIDELLTDWATARATCGASDFLPRCYGLIRNS